MQSASKPRLPQSHPIILKWRPPSQAKLMTLGGNDDWGHPPIHNQVPLTSSLNWRPRWAAPKSNTKNAMETSSIDKTRRAKVIHPNPKLRRTLTSSKASLSFILSFDFNQLKCDRNQLSIPFPFSKFKTNMQSEFYSIFPQMHNLGFNHSFMVK